MENTTNKRVRIEVVSTAVIFLLVGLLLGSGVVLCILAFVPINAIDIRVFGSIAVVFGSIVSIFAGGHLKYVCNFFS